jgi:hypothetical protein
MSRAFKQARDHGASRAEMLLPIRTPGWADRLLLKSDHAGHKKHHTGDLRRVVGVRAAELHLNKLSANIGIYFEIAGVGPRIPRGRCDMVTISS